MMQLQKIKVELNALKSYEVVLFGSIAKGQATARSDRDIAVLSRLQDRKKNQDLWYSLLAKAPNGYDLKVFELLPLPLQIEITNTHKVVFGDAVAISEYFYHFRKLWKDVEKRYRENQFTSIRERKEALGRVVSMR